MQVSPPQAPRASFKYPSSTPEAPLLYLDTRATIGRLLTTWMFWVVFAVMVGVRIYIGTVTGDDVRHTSIIIGSFVTALAFTWGWERWMKDAV